MHFCGSPESIAVIRGEMEPPTQVLLPIIITDLLHHWDSFAGSLTFQFPSLQRGSIVFTLSTAQDAWKMQ